MMAFGLRAELGPAKRPARLHIRVAEKGVGGVATLGWNPTRSDMPRGPRSDRRQ